MNDNKIELSGIFSEGYGIIPKKLMRMKLDEIIGKQKGKNVKLVLAYMLSYTGAGNQCFPGIETIASDLEISRDTVMEAIKNAENLHMLTKSKMFPNDPLKRNNKYTLDFLTLDSTFESRSSRLTTSDGSTFDVVTVDSINNSINNNSINNNNNKTIEKIIHKIYGEYNNIKLTDIEYNKLYNKYSDNLIHIINYLSCYKQEKGYKTKSDYLTILRWVADAALKNKTGSKLSKWLNN